MRQATLRSWRQANSVPARLLCQIQASVGRLHQFIPRAAVFGIIRSSRADRDWPRNARELPGFNGLAQFLRDSQGVNRIRLREQNCELLASKPAQNINLPQLLMKNRRHLAQHLVPEQVPELIVQSFELINVNHEYCQA